jgi:hypothetical protein
MNNSPKFSATIKRLIGPKLRLLKVLMKADEFDVLLDPLND